MAKLSGHIARREGWLPFQGQFGSRGSHLDVHGDLTKMAQRCVEPFCFKLTDANNGA